MNTQTDLSSLRHKELRNRHPLYRRLSGEGVWLFLEELGLTEAQCEAFMEVFFQQMEAILGVMDRLETSQEYIGIIDGTPLDGCTCPCRPGGRAAWPETTPGFPLPPYAIGCPLRVRLEPAHTAPLFRQPHEADLGGKHAAEQPSFILCPALASAPLERLPRYLASGDGTAADEKN